MRPIPRHLFSGWLICGECGARFTLVNQRSYGCASHVNGRACSNTILVKRELVEDRLLAGIQETLARPNVAAEIERQVRKALVTKRTRKPDGKRVAALTTEIDNLVSAIASGGL